MRKDDPAILKALDQIYDYASNSRAAARGSTLGLVHELNPRGDGLPESAIVEVLRQIRRIADEAVRSTP